ncbi:hypothetical protein [Paenibacillus sp. Leaf72]|uniref:hypothetical protein n=1 Tax=Paenibacillus sp. Leaf72 TaxID=1736234 RepID=UPI0006F900E3|nr:hypothetical protein [Paenibacillus sp. Leaf72]KQN96902.1 hypothetical protein ASF12_22805 [Paenibacillus sp. Leaf72]
MEPNTQIELTRDFARLTNVIHSSGMNKESEELQRICNAFNEEINNLKQEREKAIVALKMFADKDPYATSAKAKSVLSELGIAQNIEIKGGKSTYEKPPDCS